MARQIKDYLVPNSFELLSGRLSNNDDFEKFRGSDIVDIETIERQYRQSLNTFIDISLRWGVEPILMTQFNRINSDDELFNSNNYSIAEKEMYILNYMRLNEVIREVSASRQIDLIDLAKLIPSSSEYMYDPFHLNENGSILAAEILTDFWTKKLTL